MSLFGGLFKSVIGKVIGAILGGPAGWIASAALTFAPSGDKNKFRIDLDKGSWNIEKRPDIDSEAERIRAQRLLQAERAARMQETKVHEKLFFVIKDKGTGEYLQVQKIKTEPTAKEKRDALHEARKAAHLQKKAANQARRDALRNAALNITP